jgi:hypothetical protein
MIRTGSCLNRSLHSLTGTVVLATLLAAPAMKSLRRTRSLQKVMGIVMVSATPPRPGGSRHRNSRCRSMCIAALLALSSGAIQPARAADNGPLRTRPATGVSGVWRALPGSRAPDPCRNYRYCIRWAGGKAGAVNHATASGPISGQAGGTAANSVQLSLDQGVITNTGFASWVNGSTTSPASDITIDEVNEAGTTVGSRHFTACHALVAQTLPDLESTTATVRIAHIKLQCLP